MQDESLALGNAVDMLLPVWMVLLPFGMVN